MCVCFLIIPNEIRSQRRPIPVNTAPTRVQTFHAAPAQQAPQDPYYQQAQQGYYNDNSYYQQQQQQQQQQPEPAYPQLCEWCVQAQRYPP